MSGTTDTYLLLRAFVDELARSGVAGACTSPGSRSTPLVLSLVRDGRIPCFSHVDERAAGFFAIGLAKATERPVVLACTSGTAAANYAPAVHEAAQAGVPLIVLTADRPAELRDVGAGQVIDQIKLFGSAATWFTELAVADATPATLRWVRQLACRTVAAAAAGPGVVHVNIPLREPLVLTEALGEEPGGGGRPDGRPWTLIAPHADQPGALFLEGDGVVVAGRGGGQGRELAEALGWPLLADPLSGARGGPNAVAHYDALLRDDGFAAARRPDTVVRIGDLPTSKPLRQWLAGLESAEQIHAGTRVWHDPDGALTATLPATLRTGQSGDETLELQHWRAADAAAATAIAEVLEGEGLSEPGVARFLAGALPPQATLVVASSMPIRDVETFAAARENGPRVLANRGANGIDGTISTAYGVAAAGQGPTVLHVGDVALAHDLGGLLAGPRLGLPLTIVLVDNGGGGIFDFLPVSTQRDAFEEHVATPTGLDAEKIAALFGARFTDVADEAALGEALKAAIGHDGTSIVRIRTDRTRNVALHREIWGAVSTRIGQL